MDAVTTHDCCAVSSMRKSTPDLVVIGAGSAGFSAAIRASELGANVALVGAGTIGGTCVNIGCVPSKTMIRAAETLHQAKAASRFAGITASARLTDWAALMVQKDALVAGMREAKYAALLPQYEGVRYVEGAARFTADGLVAGDEHFPAERVVIATGASPAIPPIPGIGDVAYLTSTTALALDRLPRSLLVIGGGVIGCELGQMFARFGVAVTIVCRSHLLPGFEPEVVAALTGYLHDEGIAVRCGLAYQRIRRDEAGIALDVTADGRPETIRAEQVLVATGRVANTAGLDLAAVGIATDARGAIVVDEFLATSHPGVYAAGDVTGRDQFVYMAAYGAKLAAENALNGNARRYDARAMPEVVFTDPQAARVGRTEGEARAQGLAVRTVTLTLDQVPRALAARDTRGLIKLVAEEGSLRLLGAQILAPEGADSIQTAVLAIKHRLTVTDLAETLFPYLTTVEGLKLAALGFQKDVAKLSCCAG
ncbi:MAG: mercury(II) reductase [Acidibrevibacterium sp.]|uniref:mercury(II) reductase n=1 Tax=Acidibrevibacterium sp. TaxID=2606776 RepID=UPI003D0039A4